MSEVIITQLIVDASGAKMGVADFEASMAKAKTAATDTGAAMAGGPNSFDAALRKWTASLAATDPVLKAQVNMQKALEAQMLTGNRAVELGITTQGAAAAQLENVRLKHVGLIDKMKDSQNAATGFGGAMETVTGFLKSFGIALGIGELISFAKEVFNSAASLVNQAATVGVSVEALQAYRAAMGAVGVDTETADTVIRKLEKSLGAAKEAAGPARDVFFDLSKTGLMSMGDLSLSAEDALPKIAKALLSIHDPAIRAHDEILLFGRAGQEIEPALLHLSEGIATLEEKSRLLGLTLDTDVAQAALDSSIKMEESWTRLKIAATPMIVGLTEGFTGILDALTRLSNADSIWDKILQRITELIPFLAPLTMGIAAIENYAGGGVPAPGAGAGGGKPWSASSGTLGHPPGAPPPAKPNSGLSTPGLDTAEANARQLLSIANETGTAHAADLAIMKLGETALKDMGDKNGVILNTTQATAAIERDLGKVRGDALITMTRQNTETKAAAAVHDHIKQTLTQYIQQLQEAARLAGVSTNEKQDELDIIKGAQIVQKERGVKERDLVQTYAQANAILSQQEQLTIRVANAQGRTNALVTVNAVTQGNQLKLLQAEILLIDKSNMERAVVIARLREMQKLQSADPSLKSDGSNASPAQAADLKLVQDVAAATVTLTTDTELYNKSLSYQVDLLGQIDKAAQTASAGMADAFGNIGAAIGNLTTIMTGYATLQAKLAAEEADRIAKGTNDVKAQTLAAGEAAQAQTQYYGDMLKSAKGFFGEKTAAYKILSAAEGIYNAIQLVNSMARTSAAIAETTAKVTGIAVVSGAQVTGASVETGTTAVSTANASTQATSWGIAGIAKAIASLPFPMDLVAGAAVAAALVAAGVSLFGGGGSGGAAPVDTTAKDRQALQGSGTLLGDPTGKSDSIAKSIDQLAKDANADLEYSNEMLTSLRAIQNSIGSVASLLSAQLGIGGSLNTSKLGLGSSSSPGILGLFASTKSTTLQDEGIQFTAQTIGSAIANGISARIFQAVTTTKTNSGFFGLFASSSTKTATTHTATPGDFNTEIGALIASMRDTVVTAATKLGVAGAAAAIDTFSIDLGSVSLKDMTGQQIQDTLNALFSKLGDQMAGAAVPFIASLQKVGEGALETLSRVVNEVIVVGDSMKTMGLTFGLVGIDAIKASDNLVQLAGGLDKFSSQAQFFVSNFLDAAQANAPIQAAVSAEMARLGESSVTTKAQFAALVQGIDVTTDAGAALYTALMNVAPAFAKVADYQTASVDFNTKIMDGINGFIDGPLQQWNALIVQQTAQMADAKAAGADLGLVETLQALQRKSLLMSLDDAQRTSLLSLIGLADSLSSKIAVLQAASLTAVNAQITAAQGFAQSQTQLAAQYGSASTGLNTARVGFLADPTISRASPTDAYGQSRTALDAASASAKGGDLDALNSLSSLSKSFLQNSLSVNATSQPYSADFTYVQKLLADAKTVADKQQSATLTQAQLATQQVTVLQTIAAQLQKPDPNTAILTSMLGQLGALDTAMNSNSSAIIATLEADPTAAALASLGTALAGAGGVQSAAVTNAILALQTATSDGLITVGEAASVTAALAVLRADVSGRLANTSALTQTQLTSLLQAQALLGQISGSIGTGVNVLNLAAVTVPINALLSATGSNTAAVVTAINTGNSAGAANASALSDTMVGALITLTNASVAGYVTIAAAGPTRDALTTLQSSVVGMLSNQSALTTSQLAAANAAKVVLDGINAGIAAGMNVVNLATVSGPLTTLVSLTSSGSAVTTAAINAANTAAASNVTLQTGSLTASLLTLQNASVNGLLDVKTAGPTTAALTSLQLAVSNLLSNQSALTSSQLAAANAANAALMQIQSGIGTGVNVLNLSAISGPIATLISATYAATGAAATNDTTQTGALTAALATLQAASTNGLLVVSTAGPTRDALTTLQNAVNAVLTNSLGVSTSQLNAANFANVVLGQVNTGLAGGVNVLNLLSVTSAINSLIATTSSSATSSTNTLAGALATLQAATVNGTVTITAAGATRDALTSLQNSVGLLLSNAASLSQSQLTTALNAYTALTQINTGIANGLNVVNLSTISAPINALIGATTSAGLAAVAAITQDGVTSNMTFTAAIAALQNTTSGGIGSTLFFDQQQIAAAYKMLDQNDAQYSAAVATLAAIQASNAAIVQGNYNAANDDARSYDAIASGNVYALRQNNSGDTTNSILGTQLGGANSYLQSLPALVSINSFLASGQTAGTAAVTAAIAQAQAASTAATVAQTSALRGDLVNLISAQTTQTSVLGAKLDTSTQATKDVGSTIQAGNTRLMLA